jgi:hypothetical protein
MRLLVSVLVVAASFVAQARDLPIAVSCQPHEQMGLICDYSAGGTSFSVLGVGHRLGSGVNILSLQHGDRILVNATYTAIVRKVRADEVTRFVCHKTGRIVESNADCPLVTVQ